jgi:TatD DNase family protein
LAPVPHRGKRNEPAFVKFVAEKLAEIKNLSVEEIEKITTENAKRLFKFPSP